MPADESADRMAALPPRLQQRIDPHGDARYGVPAWLRRTSGENRLPVALAVAVAVALQVALPDQLSLRPRYLLPALEAVLLVALVVANPVRFSRDHPVARVGSLLLTAAVTLANAVSAALLVHALLSGKASNDPAGLLGSGAAVYLTNIIAFGLWYWEFDRGGPFERAAGTRPYPDFLFPQMTLEHLAPDDWEPQFVDYLYVSFTNAVALSPTDTMPLSRWTKVLMLVQSSIALLTIGLVIARAINVLR